MVEQPSGARPGSSRPCWVTRIDGSGMRVPRSISAAKAWSHSVPKWMLWCALPGGGAPFTPATHSTQLGEYRPRRAARGASTPPSRVR